MVVQNDTPDLGHMHFYEVPIESETKLLGPTSVLEALDRDPDFAQLKTLFEILELVITYYIKWVSTIPTLFQFILPVQEVL